MESTDQPLEDICAHRTGVDSDVLEQVVVLAIELAREGREGRKVGTIFMVGDAEAVMTRSRPMILDPLYGHADADKHIEDANARETLKELSQLDGAFVISDDGELVAEILPELWMMRRYSSHIQAPVFTQTSEKMTVHSKVE